MIELRPFLDSIKEYLTNEQFNKIRGSLLTREDWLEVEILINILKPFNKYSKKMQAKSCCLSDFFGYWLSVQLAMEKLGNDELALLILDEMKNRKQSLFENPVMVSAIYMDPRYQRILDDNQKQLAVYFLSQLYIKIKQIEANEQNLDANNTDIAVENQINNSNSSETSVDLADYLNRFIDNSINRNEVETSANWKLHIEELLKDFNGTNIPSIIPVLDYWKSEKENKPDLYKLATVIYVVQATQTSVERAFSTFGLILTSRRTSLSDQNLQNILCIKLNST